MNVSILQGEFMAAIVATLLASGFIVFASISLVFLTMLIALPFVFFILAPFSVPLVFAVAMLNLYKDEKIKNVEKRRILVVDDELASVLPLVTLLERQDSEVHFVSSGRQMLEELSQGDFDLVFLDNKMPDLSGEAALSLGEKVLHRATPQDVIFYSGSATRVQIPGHLKQFKVKGVWSKNQVFQLERQIASILA
jgi:CheY-like chemotaxis protein